MDMEYIYPLVRKKYDGLGSMAMCCCERFLREPLRMTVVFGWNFDEVTMGMAPKNEATMGIGWDFEKN